MITIGVELNHVVRNINKQILKYYDKAYNKGWDLDEMDTLDDALKLATFPSKNEKYNFFYIDYPFELFASAETVEKWLSVKLTNWLADVEDIEDEDIRIVFYSMNEANLTIQSTYFFLSKLGARVRKMLFPRNIKEVWDECDVVITANKEFLEEEVPDGKKVVLINRPFNEDVKDKAFANYDNLSAVIEDNNFFKSIL
jgi:hypothetical protein